jgi:hypothetical protein
MVPIGTTNLFIGSTGIINPIESAGESSVRLSPTRDFDAPGQLYTTTLTIPGDIPADDNTALLDDADSVAAGSVAGSIMPASIANSIVPLSNPGDFEDGSILHLFDSNSETESSARNATPPLSWPVMIDQQPPLVDPVLHTDPDDRKQR